MDMVPGDIVDGMVTRSDLAICATYFANMGIYCNASFVIIAAGSILSCRKLYHCVALRNRNAPCTTIAATIKDVAILGDLFQPMSKKNKGNAILPIVLYRKSAGYKKYPT